MTKLAAYLRCTALAKVVILSLDVRSLKYVVCKCISVKAILNYKLILACNTLNGNGYLNLSSCEVSCGLIDLTAECAERNEVLRLKSLLNRFAECFNVFSVVEAYCDMLIDLLN